ncbi:flagellin, partial [Chelatococcus sp. SYSU_G07232]
VAELRTQIDQLSKDASYNGINLLAGDSMTTYFNETGSSKQKIQGVYFDSTGLKVSLAKNDFQADSDINAALAELKSAAETLRAQASTFGANLSVLQNRQDFTKGLVHTLTTGADALVLADPNEEGAKLLALQTRQQLSQTAMSMANQSESAVLRLFG